MIVPGEFEQPKIKGILAIDCWEQSDLDGFYNQLKQHIDFDEIDSIVVASFETALDSSDVSLTNTLEQYSWDHYTPSVLLPLLKETRNRTTSSWLKSKFSTHSFMLLDMDSFVLHNDRCVPHVNDWLVIGGAWLACTHCRPISFYGIKNKSNRNFYIADWSIYTRDKDFVGSLDRNLVEQDILHWQSHNGLYKLVK